MLFKKQLKMILLFKYLHKGHIIHFTPLEESEELRRFILHNKKRIVYEFKQGLKHTYYLDLKRFLLLVEKFGVEGELEKTKKYIDEIKSSKKWQNRKTLDWFIPTHPKEIAHL